MPVYTARHAYPISAPPIRDAALRVLDGRIVEIGTRAAVAKHTGDDEAIVDLGDAILMPGSVNAHTHLELSWMAGIDEGVEDPVEWLERLVALRDEEDESRSIAAARQAIGSIVARGTVAVGDIANRLWIAECLRESGLRGIVFHEVFGFQESRAERLADEAYARTKAVTDSDAFGLQPTPHAPHTCSPSLLRDLARRSRESGGRLSIHLAETPGEVRLLQEGVGPLVPFYRARGVWDEEFRAPGRSPVAYADELGLLGPDTLAVHCVHVDDDDMARLRTRGVTVIACPRSNERLVCGTAPVPQLLEQGIPVALGTDSLASAPDLDLLAEVAALRRIHPSISPPTALRMATLAGAKALGLAAELGSLEPGKRDAVAVVECDPGDDPLELLVSNPERVRPLAIAAAERLR